MFMGALRNRQLSFIQYSILPQVLGSVYLSFLQYSITPHVLGSVYLSFINYICDESQYYLLTPCSEWVIVGQTACVPRADNPFTLSWKLHRVSSFIFVTPNVSLFTDAFSREALIPVYSLRSECADTLVTSRSEDAFIDLIANSILGAIMLSIAANIAFCILSSTVSTILFISLSILSLKHLSKHFHNHRIPINS